jgi:hypothetical protein
MNPSIAERGLMSPVEISLPRALVLLLLGTLAVIAIPALVDAGFYYDDDVRHYFMPQVLDVGLRLGQSEFPWITARAWFSGNYVGEGLLSLFNPINLGLYWLCARMGSPEAAALLFAGTYLLLTSLGMFTLARSYSVSRTWSVVAALAYCSSGFSLYWWASSWWNALVGFCWMIWAWVGWRLYISHEKCGLVAFFGTYFLLVSGWPHGVIMGVIAALVEMFEARREFLLAGPGTDGIARLARVKWPRLSRVFLLAILAALASLLSNYPAYLHAQGSGRIAWGLSGGATWVGSLDYILAAGWPSFLGTPGVFFGDKTTAPAFYLAWIVPPALLMLFRRDNWTHDSRMLRPLLLVGAIAAVLTLGPQQLFFLRWPLRFLSFAHVAFAVAACFVLARADLASRPNRLILVSYAIAGLLVSLMIDPEIWLVHILLNGIALLGTLIVASKPAHSHLRPLGAATFLLLLQFMTHTFWPRNDTVGHWSVPRGASYPANPEAFSPDNRMVLMRSSYPCNGDKCPLASGNIGMWEEGRAINGYSPTGAKVYHSVLGFDPWSRTSPTSLIPLTLAAYFARDKETSEPRYRLMRINEFRAAGPLLPEQLEQVMRDEWRTSNGPNGTVFRLVDDYSLPGTVSWASPHLELAADARFSSVLEKIIVTANDASGGEGRIIFARAWYPGYAATLDGRPVEVQEHGDMLVSVRIPPGASGTLELRFRPPGISWTAPLATASFLFALLLAFAPFGRRSVSHA